METLKELLDAIRLGLTERITSPLLGNFIISWSLWNYRLFVTLISDTKVEDKYRIIDNVLYPNAAAYWVAFIVPVTATLFIIYIYPIFARYVYEHRLRVNKDLMERRRRVEDTEPLDMEQARQLRIGMREKEQQWGSRVAALEQENEDLRRSLESSQSKQVNQKSSSPQEGGKRIKGTTKTIAAKLGVKSGKALVIAAAVQLTLVENKHTFTRQELLDSMRSATGLYRKAYVNNLTTYIDQAINDQVLIESATNQYALSEDQRKNFEAMLSK